MTIFFRTKTSLITVIPYSFIWYSITCMSLFISCLVFAQKTQEPLGWTQSPKLIYSPKEVNVSRDLFSVKPMFEGEVRKNNAPISLAVEPLVPVNQQVLCEKNTQTLVYLGMFSTAGEDAAMIRNSELDTLKVKVGDVILNKQLTLQKITQNYLTAAYPDLSTCSLNKLSY